MSLFHILISDNPLKEVDYTGITEITIREMKKLYPIKESEPAQSWHFMDDDATILHAKDESAFSQLCITKCKKPPFDLLFYTDEEEHVYWIEGGWREQFIPDFKNYVRDYIKATDNVELLIFWAGDGVQKLKNLELSIMDVSPEQISDLAKSQNVRVQFV